MTAPSERVFDRVPSDDPRSANYPIRGLVSTALALPSRRVWTPGVALDQGSEGACFTGDVLIRMADGSQKPIETISVLDKVATAEGRTGTVLQVMARRHDGPLVSVKAWGHSHLRCTPEHPILTRRGYVPAKELTGDDWIALPRFAPPAPAAAIAVRDIVSTAGLRSAREGQIVHTGLYGDTDTAVTALPEKVDLTADFGRLIGLYAAEGHQTANKVVWSYGSHEHETLVPETVDLVWRVFGAQARIQVRPNGAVNVVLYGKHWRLLFASLVPGTSKHGDKHLSRHVTNGPVDYLRAVLDGWYDGDGHIRRRADHEARDGVSVSRHLATDMHAIAVACGLRPAIVRSEPSANRHALTRQTRWNITLPSAPGIDAPEELRPTYCQCGCGEQVEERKYRVNRYLHDHATRPGAGGAARWRSQQDDTHLWRKVREVVEEPFVGDYVFNLEVEGDHSYIADGVGVHNCVGFAWTNELACTPVSVKGLGAPHALTTYRQAQKIDEWPGERYSGTSVLAGAKVLVARGYLKEYRWAVGGADDVVTGLLRTGPCVLGVEWYDSAYETRPSGLIDLSGKVVGGHAILAFGFIPDMLIEGKREAVVALFNSWGPSWGNGGVGWVRVDDLDQWLRNRGEACFPTRRSFGPPAAAAA